MTVQIDSDITVEWRPRAGRTMQDLVPRHRHVMRRMVLVVVLGLLPLLPRIGSAEPTAPAVATGIAVDRAATAAAARQFLTGEPIVVDWDDPNPRIDRPQRQYRSHARGRPDDTDLVDRAAASSLPSPDRLRIERLTRSLDAQRATLQRRIEAQPKLSATQKALEPDRARRQRARSMTLDLERRTKNFEARALSRTTSVDALRGLRSSRR